MHTRMKSMAILAMKYEIAPLNTSNRNKYMEKLSLSGIISSKNLSWFEEIFSELLIITWFSRVPEMCIC